MKLNGLKTWWKYGEKEVIAQGAIVKHETTTCNIELPNNEVVSATISRHHKDKPDWEKARTLTLSRAMAAANISRGVRIGMWEDYKNTKPGGRWS